MDFQHFQGVIEVIGLNFGEERKAPPGKEALKNNAGFDLLMTGVVLITIDAG